MANLTTTKLIAYNDHRISKKYQFSSIIQKNRGFLCQEPEVYQRNAPFQAVGRRVPRQGESGGMKAHCRPAITLSLSRYRAGSPPPSLLPSLPPPPPPWGEPRPGAAPSSLRSLPPSEGYGHLFRRRLLRPKRMHAAEASGWPCLAAEWWLKPTSSWFGERGKEGGREGSVSSQGDYKRRGAACHPWRQFCRTAEELFPRRATSAQSSGSASTTLPRPLSTT